MYNMGFRAQWAVCSASAPGSPGECRQICTSPHPSDTRFDHLRLLLIELAPGFKPTVAFGVKAGANCLKARNVIKCRYKPKSNNVHFRLGCWHQVFSMLSVEFPYFVPCFLKPRLPVRCDLVFAAIASDCIFHMIWLCSPFSG